MNYRYLFLKLSCNRVKIFYHKIILCWPFTVIESDSSIKARPFSFAQLFFLLLRTTWFTLPALSITAVDAHILFWELYIFLKKSLLSH